MINRNLPLAVLAAACALALPVVAVDGPVCADCHDEVAAGMAHQIHMRIQPFEVSGRQVGCEDRVRQPVMCRITGCGRGSTGRGPGACFRVSERGSTRDEVERRAACPATHALIVAARCSERACRARASSPSTAFGVRPSSALSSRVERPAKYLRRRASS